MSLPIRLSPHPVESNGHRRRELNLKIVVKHEKPIPRTPLRLVEKQWSPREQQITRLLPVFRRRSRRAFFLLHCRRELNRKKKRVEMHIEFNPLMESPSQFSIGVSPQWVKSNGTSLLPPQPSSSSSLLFGMRRVFEKPRQIATVIPIFIGGETMKTGTTAAICSSK